MNQKSEIRIFGRVIHGQHYGKKLGFPTANLDRREYVKQKKKIKFGVWAGIARFKVQGLRFKVYLAGIVIGPKDKRGLPRIEAHLIGFKGNLYGKKLQLRLQKYLRPYKKFKDVGQLKKQIARDINSIKRLKIK